MVLLGGLTGAIMRHGFSLATQKLIGAVLLTIYLQANFSIALSEDTKSRDETLQFDTDVLKRSWDKNPKMWGKRAWSSLHGGWGIKRSAPDDFETDTGDKRSWGNFRDGWGKRLSDEDLIPEEMLILENDAQNPDLDYNQDKRSWNQLNHGWGKRNKWSEFRGAWGKRSPEPAWNNLKGIWGKRSNYDNALQ